MDSTPSERPSDPATPTPSATPSPRSVPEARTPVFVIVFENKDAAEILSGDQAPFIASLARDYAYAANYRAITYPSQPNYLALFSGSTHGVTDNELHDIEAPTLADQVEAAGLTWRVAMENVAPGCFIGPFSLDGPDGEGIYSRKHNPAITFTSISRDPVRCASITDFTSFDPEAADFTFIVPNNCHSMHDCSIAEGDAWLQTFLPRILGSRAYRDGGVVFITVDEDRGDGDNFVATVVVSERAVRGAASERPYTHYSLLRTVQELLGLECLVESCNAVPMSDLIEGLGAD
ncbi:MAG: alkaline phosphatase family protein [Candidatus Limnocylindria bacterium]